MPTLTAVVDRRPRPIDRTPEEEHPRGPQTPSLDPPTNICASPPSASRHLRAVLAAFTGPDTRREEERWRDRLATCQTCPLIAEDAQGLPVLIRASCSHRLCPTCQRARAARLSASIAREVQGWPAVRFLTLTLATSDAPLRLELQRLMSSFRELRRTRTWQRHVSAAIWTLEVTRCAKTGRWHPHLHLLLRGTFIPHAQLKTAWHRITGDSFIVDVRMIHDRRQAARYLAKYVAKAADLGDWPPASIRDYCRSTFNLRSHGTCGTLHGRTIDRTLRELRPKLKTYVISFAKLRALYLRQNPLALRACYLGRLLGPQWSHFLRLAPPDHRDPAPSAATYEEFLALCHSLEAAECPPPP